MRVGIDLGTTYSLIAEMGVEGRPTLIPDCSDPELVHTPSSVHIAGCNAFVGTMAEALLESDPSLSVVRFFKRQLGNAEPVFFDDKGQGWLAEAVSALVLKKLVFDAESASSGRVDSVVITVPAHFNDPQRKAVLRAAALAKLTVLGLVEEPVAAALHYGVETGAHDRVLLVYDFGGGTFDATVLSMDQGGVYVLAKTGLTELGGKEIDERVGEMVLGQFERALGHPVSTGARTLLELRRVSEEIKIELCLPGCRGVHKLVLLGGQAVEVEITAAQFESAIKDIVDQTEMETVRCVREAGLQPADVTHLLLVGGSSLVPLTETRLRAIFSKPSQQVLYHEPSKAVAYGAALHASQLAGEAERYQIPPELRGVSGYHVGVRTVDPTTGMVAVDTVVKKNMPLPIKVRKTYYTSRPRQERIVLDLVQYRDPREKLVSLGRLVVGPLDSARQNYPVEVTTEYRVDGTVAVEAYDANTGMELAAVFGGDADSGGAGLALQKALVDSTVINNVIS
ncbi:MAG TPA: Hsp70 family protein [Vicinamibacteria bacterium]|nr:Hsp70 family protein [Vicinamibacteria bacterium]